MTISEKQIIQLISCLHEYRTVIRELIRLKIASDECNRQLDASSILLNEITSQQSEQLREIE